MTSNPERPTGPPAFALHTFGTLRLVGKSNNTVLGDHGHQRRRLGLLAILAASGEGGRSRDQILGLLWPEVSQEKGRHSLDQLLYAIRTALDGPVFTGGNSLRLNPEFVASDIADFFSALDRGKPEEAVDIYRGPFLDGFYLGDASEFEQWLDAERARLAHRYADALESLSRKSEEKKEFATAVQWRRKLAEADPVSSKYAIGLMRALMNSGDTAGALSYAKRYETIVGQELDTSVGPAVTAVIAEVRARAKTDHVLGIDAAGAVPQLRSPQVMHPVAPAGNVSVQLAFADDSNPRTQPELAPRARGSRRVLYTVGALVLATIAIAFVWARSANAHARASAIGAPSIAVLPLVNVGNDPGDAVVVDGLSEDLTAIIAKIHGLRVVARTSAFVFRDSKLDVRRIADSLQVSTLLEGSVQKSGDRIRVQVRLVDASNGSARWSETYDRSLGDIFLVQSEIAAAVAKQLDLRLGGAPRGVAAPPTRNVAAYELYLRGNDPVLLRSDSTARLAVGFYRQAIALDSGYAGAYAGLARSYLTLIGRGDGGIPNRELLTLGRRAADKSVALDDSLAEGHASVGMAAKFDYDFKTAERELDLAVRLDPTHSRIREWLGRVYYWRQRPGDALAEARRAVVNDPLSPSAHAEVAHGLCATGRAAEGLAELKAVDAVKPPLLRTRVYAALCYSVTRDWPAAIAVLREARGSQSRAMLAFMLSRAGRREEALSIVRELIDRAKRTNAGAFEVAIAYAGLGNKDEAFAWLDRSVNDLSLTENIMLPLFDDLHADARFDRLLRRIGLQRL